MAEVLRVAHPVVARRSRRWLVRELQHSTSAVVGLVILSLIVISALFAPQLAPYDPLKQNIRIRLLPPSWMEGGRMEYLLGTDNLGRDILSRIIYGARVAVSVPLAAVSFAVLIGVTLGLLAGYFRGRVDEVIMRITDVQLAIPFILIVIAVIALFGTSLTNLIIVLGITGWLYYARLVRSEVLAMREREYVTAARALGMSNFRIMLRHVLPGVIPTIIVLATVDVARVTLIEAALSFVGLGVQPPTPTWGGMVSDGRNHIFQAWWFSTFPGVTITLQVLGVNLLGDWLRVVLDPRLRHG
ncbi:MAG: ABC transporter permease [Deinococcus sp.]|nr:ABC transporter permease [Deinococcus sp.]